MVTIFKCKNLLVFIVVVVCQSIVAEELDQETIDKTYYASYVSEKIQDYPAAINAMEPVLKAYPKGYTVNFRLGWLSYLSGRYADALKYYASALSVYPASIEVMQCMSLVYKARQEWPKVESQNYTILKVDYFNQTSNFWYAYALKIQKKYDLADKVCRKMLTVFPTSVTFLNELGENLYYKKDYTQSLSMFLSVRTLDPSNENAKKIIALITGPK